MYPKRNVTFEIAFQEVNALVDQFETFQNRFLDQSYNEQALRDDFIKRFLWALGWDVEHRLQKDPLEQEVKVERSVKVEGAASVGAGRKKADYAFFIAPYFHPGDERLFFEIKRPSATLATDRNYFQTVRYGWSVQNPVAVLTNFHELRVLDCRYEPNIKTITQCEIKDYVFHFTEYRDEERFAKLFYLVSRDAVSAGSLGILAALLPKRRGKTVQRVLFPGGYETVGVKFLEDLDGWRLKLARTLKTENKWLDGETLTEITQRILDRLIFLRFLEDKLIETKESVGKFGDGGSVWNDFVSASQRLNSIYNGIVFKEHELIDKGNLVVDEHVFHSITEDISSINSPYDFNHIPIHILGSIYEGFLGKVIRTTASTAKIEDKPEVRKAGGVFYTPEYVVRYIVDNTIGKLIGGKSPTQIAKMRFADISSGSGSFLLGVYDCILRYHKRWYNAHPSKASHDDYLVDDDGVFHVSLKKKREILIRNIFGVDIDHQAVEVAQLSLYLKLLEEETTSTAKNFQHELHQTLLPSLGNNIVSGNSLVGTDILANNLFPDDEERRLNPMNFGDRFPDVAKAGGFDAVVGNPPWGATLDNQSLEYLRVHFSRVVARMVDSYIYFIDQAIRLLKPSGYLGFIVPGTMLNQVDATPVRQLLSKHGPSHLINLGQKVFGPKVLNTSAIFISGNQGSKQIVVGELSAVPPEKKGAELFALRPTALQKWAKLVQADPHHTYFTSDIGAPVLLGKLRKQWQPLSDYIVGTIQRGVSPDIVAAHVVSDKLVNQWGIEKELLRPSISGSQLRRYSSWAPDQFVLYSTRETDIRAFPGAFAYLSQFKSQNTCPEVRDKKHPWWSLHRPRDETIFTSPKFIGLTTSKSIEIIYDADESLFVTDSMYVIKTIDGIDPMAFIAVMHSRTFLALYRISNQGEARVIPQVKASKLSTLPFPDLRQIDQTGLSALATSLKKAANDKKASTTDKAKDYYQNRCADLENRIELMVANAYGLTSEEYELLVLTATQ